jgi:hypothetical protein
MERVYLGLAIVGYLIPNTLTLIESVQTGNILFWTNPARTTSELFSSRTSAAFALDLFGAAVVALIWMTQEARRVGIGAGLALLGADAPVRGGGHVAAVSVFA